MSITTYAELQTAVADWAHRSDLTSKIVDCIALCEARLNDMLLLKNMESEDAVALTIGSNSAALPTGYISPIAFWIVVNGIRTPLDFRLPQELPYYISNSRPKFVAIDGANLRFDVPSDQAYTGYLRSIKASNLSIASPTNYLLTKRPDVYLAGTLAEVARFTRNIEMLNVWEQKFLSMCQDLKAAEGRSRGIVQLTNDAVRRRFHSNILTDT